MTVEDEEDMISNTHLAGVLREALCVLDCLALDVQVEAILALAWLPL